MMIERVQLALSMTAVLALATTSGSTEFRGYCSETAYTLYAACVAERTDDAAVEKAICNNLSDRTERDQCFVERDEALDESRELCPAQRNARLRVCKALGEARYDPDFSPGRFDDPKNPTTTNPYYPLQVGHQWEYRGGDERVTVEVLDETKRMPGGVDCIVVRDLVWKAGDLIEATDDWIVHAMDGAVWYCGEEVKNLESFEGDMPRREELIDVDGSFKAGRNGDKPGILFLASPSLGDLYREEFSLGNAEDIAQVLTAKYAYGKSSDLDRFVPRQLVDLLCHDDCVVTKNVNLLEPDVIERKYYAPGIGFFLEVALDTGETVQLVDCSFDARCDGLPTP